MKNDYKFAHSPSINWDINIMKENNSKVSYFQLQYFKKGAVHKLRYAFFIAFRPSTHLWLCFCKDFTKYLLNKIWNGYILLTTHPPQWHNVICEQPQSKYRLFLPTSLTFNQKKRKKSFLPLPFIEKSEKLAKNHCIWKKILAKVENESTNDSTSPSIKKSESLIRKVFSNITIEPAMFLTSFAALIRIKTIAPHRLGVFNLVHLPWDIDQNLETDAKKRHTPYNIPLLKNPYLLSDLHETWSK